MSNANMVHLGLTTRAAADRPTHSHSHSHSHSTTVGQLHHLPNPRGLAVHQNNPLSRSHPCLPSAPQHHKQSASLPPHLNLPSSPAWETNYDDEDDDDCAPVRPRPQPANSHSARPRGVLHKMISSVALSVRSSHESAHTHTRSHSRSSTLLGAPRTPSAASTPPSSLTPTPSTSLSSLVAHASLQARQLRSKKSSGFLGAIQRAMGANKSVPAPLHSPVSAPLGAVVRNNGKDPLPRSDPLPVALGIHCARPEATARLVTRTPNPAARPAEPQPQPRTCILAIQPQPAVVRRASLRPHPRPPPPAAPQPLCTPRIDLRPVSMAFSAGFAPEMFAAEARLSGRPEDARLDEQAQEVVGRPETVVAGGEMDEELEEEEEEEEVTVRHVEKRIVGMPRGARGEVQRQLQERQQRCCVAAREENEALKEEIGRLKALLENERKAGSVVTPRAGAGGKLELLDSSYFWKSSLSSSSGSSSSINKSNSGEGETRLRELDIIGIGEGRIGGSECLLCGR